jgi:hypothetical protein
MPKNVVCYVQRKRITDWKRKILTRTDSAFIYGSNDKVVFSKLKAGDVLWIVAQVPLRPPEIVARLEVEIVTLRDDPKLGVSEKLLEKFPQWTWIARGGKGSRFYGHNNAERAFMQSEFLTPTGKRWRLGETSAHWTDECGKRFQGPVEICPSGEELFKQIAEAPAIFISWKWKDNRKRAIRNLAFALADQGFTVWLDKLAMPASTSLERMVKNFPEALEMLLQDGYQHSSLLLAIGTRRYGVISDNSAKNWTMEEWNGALDPQHLIQRRIYHPAYSKGSSVLTQRELYLQSSDPLEAAVELKNWYHQIISLHV